MRIKALALLAGIAASSVLWSHRAEAAPVTVCDTSFQVCEGQAYQLLSNASVTGGVVNYIWGGTYIWSCLGTFNSATLTLQALGPDNSTWVTVDTMTATGQKGEVIGNGASMRVMVTGSPSSIYCSLS